MGRAFMHGWVSLPSRGEVFLEHGVPRQARVDSLAFMDVDRFVDEIADVAGLHVTLGRWVRDEESGEMETVVRVATRDIAEILRRLAQESAETFYDRYRKPIDAEDVDFDDEAYALDLNLALVACGLKWSEIDEHALRDDYRRALHLASTAIARQPE